MSHSASLTDAASDASLWQSQRDTIESYLPQLRAIRQQIHQHPEIGFEEQLTATLIIETLTGWGIPVTQGIGATGVVGSLTGRLPGQRSIGLRADMDALYLQEQSDLPYASQHPGKMHACGHDGHVAMLLGAARYLAEHPDFAGTVNFIFQPAEEGLGGAAAMLNDGLLTRFPCDALFGLHNKPGIACGNFATCSGAMLSASDTWQVEFIGKGGHGGSGAHLSVDPTLPAAQFISGLQSIISRNVPAMASAVLSVGHIHAGSIDAPNVIPERVLIKGTGRSYAPHIRELLASRLQQLALNIAQGFNARAEVRYEHQYPVLNNHPQATQQAIEAASLVVSAAQINGQMTPLLGAEDFSWMLEQRPGAFMMLGNGDTAPLHSPHYDFNDAVIPYGVHYWVSLVLQQLSAT
jgi:amidohydrolase